MNKKIHIFPGTIILIGVFVIAVAIIRYSDISYFYSDKQKVESRDTADWIIYWNEEMKFTIQLPALWTIIEKKNFLFITPYKMEPTEIPGVNFTITHLNGKTLQEENSHINFDSECQEVTLGGKFAFKCNPIISFSGETFYFISLDEYTVFEVGDYLQDESSEKVLSTLKFIKPQESIINHY